MELTEEQVDRLRMGALTAVDGLWFLELEKRYGFEAALQVDLDVWRQYGMIFFKRLMKTAGITAPADGKQLWDTMLFYLTSMCRVDGTACEGAVTGEDSLRFDVLRCPWWENMKKAGREGLIPCERIDDTIFGHVLRNMDPSITMDITRSFPRGDSRCSFIFRRQ